MILISKTFESIVFASTVSQCNWYRFYLVDKTCLRGIIDWWKPRQTFGRIREQISESPRCSREPANEYSHTLSRFSQGYGGHVLQCFFYKIVISPRNKEKTIYTKCKCILKFFFSHETVNSLNVVTANHIVNVIFVLHSVVKTYLLINWSKLTVQIIL